MKTLRFTVLVADDAVAERLIHIIGKRATILVMETLPDRDGVIGLPTVDASDHNQPEYLRNQDIIEKYNVDPIANSSGKLAVEYGISRERVCQILRPTNLISTYRARREAAREAIEDESGIIKDAAITEFKNNIDKAIVLMRGGMSQRKASAALGYQPTSSFCNTLGSRAKELGLKKFHGRHHRDFEGRKSRVLELSAAGLRVREIVTKMRAEDDPVIHAGRIYKHAPEARARKRDGAQ